MQQRLRVNDLWWLTCLLFWWMGPGISTYAQAQTTEICNNGIDDDGNGFIDDVHGWDFVNDDALPTDDHGHGTHVAGTEFHHRVAAAVVTHLAAVVYLSGAFAHIQVVWPVA